MMRSVHLPLLLLLASRSLWAHQAPSTAKRLVAQDPAARHSLPDHMNELDMAFKDSEPPGGAANFTDLATNQVSTGVVSSGSGGAEVPSASPAPVAVPATTARPGPPRYGPCQCGQGMCSCCSRILLETWKQKACVNVTYDPDEFSFTAKILMNERVVYTRSVSGKNPRPVCVPVPRVPAVRACVRFYNIYFQGRNIHACVNMEGRVRDTTLFKVNMDCVRLGASGMALVRPEDGGGIGQVEILPEDPEDVNEANEDEYDDDDDDEDDDDDDEDDDDDDDDDDEDLFDY